MNSANINGKDLDLMPLNKCIESLNKNRYNLYQSQGAGKKEFLDIFYRKNIIIDLSSLALAYICICQKTKSTIVQHTQGLLPHTTFFFYQNHKKKYENKKRKSSSFAVPSRESELLLGFDKPPPLGSLSLSSSTLPLSSTAPV